MIIDPSVIRQVSREKDIDPEKMFGALEEAMSSAARKFYHDKAVVTSIDRKTGEMTAYSRRTVVEELDTESEEPPPQILLDEAKELIQKHGTKGGVRVLRPAAKPPESAGEGDAEGESAAEAEPPTEVSDVALGDEIRQYREPVGLGRIAAQTAKQVLYQKVREAERDNIYNEFFPKLGELMVIAYAVFDLHFPGARGLKEKRMALQSLKTRIRNQFEVSVAEVDGQDLLQRGALAVAAVGPDQAPLDARMQKILSFVESNFAGEILNFENEFLHV